MLGMYATDMNDLDGLMREQLHFHRSKSLGASPNLLFKGLIV